MVHLREWKFTVVKFIKLFLFKGFIRYPVFFPPNLPSYCLCIWNFTILDVGNDQWWGFNIRNERKVNTVNSYSCFTRFTRDSMHFISQWKRQKRTSIRYCIYCSQMSRIFRRLPRYVGRICGNDARKALICLKSLLSDSLPKLLSSLIISGPVNRTCNVLNDNN